MSVNSSSSNDSFLRPNVSSINSDLPVELYCFITRPGSFVYVSVSVTNILLLLPLCVLVLYRGLQRWWQQRSTSTAATMSHSDSFTYHLVLIELFCVFGHILSTQGLFRGHVAEVSVGLGLWSFTWYAEMSFHTLTCVERYLAVVHPITYLCLRTERGIRIRNISIGCVWLLCFGETCLWAMNNVFIVVDFCHMIFTVVVITFCSVSVLCVLIRPGPGEQGGQRERVDRSKQRAFYTIMAILGVLALRLFGGLVWAILEVTRGKRECVLTVSGAWFNLPSSLVLPVLFLHRAGILACGKNNQQ